MLDACTDEDDNADELITGAGVLDCTSEAAAEDETMLLDTKGEATRAAMSRDEEGAMEDERLGLGSGVLET